MRFYKRNIHAIAFGQGVFFLLSGLWPLFHMRSFEKVTGPKKDEWLVKTVGLLIAVTGTRLIATGVQSKKVPRELMDVAVGQALVLGSVSFYYSLVGRISKIYLADTLVESLFVFLWFLSRKDDQSERKVIGTHPIKKSEDIFEKVS